MTPGKKQTNSGPILVVDDDVDVREALTEMLQYRGYAVESAANGLEALDVLRTMAARPSIILLDLMMPVMDGYGFLAERRKDPDLATIPVAIVTAGHGVDQSRVNGTTVLRKPVDMPELMRAIEQLHAGQVV